MRYGIIALILALALGGAYHWRDELMPRDVSQAKHPAPHAQGVVTFTFDDASKGQHTFALPILRAAAMTGTLYVTTHGIGNDPWNMTWDELREFMAAGFEVGAHTHTHPSLTALDEQTLREELALPKELIEKHLGVTPVAFATPYGEANDDVLKAVAEHYTSHALSWGELARVDAADHYRIVRHTVRHTDTAPMICDAMRQAGARGEWIVLAFHQVVDATEPPEWSTTKDTFESIVSCASTLRREGAVRIERIADALRTIPHKANGPDVRIANAQP